ncbi:MAG TPA: hypothetical protein VMF04_00075 [Thermoplasmata archaeon]|nr:hypothetical protein [Thermoplasmata archaeon]
MASAVPPDLLMFVAGEPDDGSRHYQPIGLQARMWGALVPTGVIFAMQPSSSALSASSRQTIAPQFPVHLPPEQIHCVNWVLEEALREHRHVTIVDVNQASTPAEFVRQWVTPDEIYPILIRPDGQRLEGVENFDLRSLREFLRPPAPQPPLPSR